MPDPEWDELWSARDPFGVECELLIVNPKTEDEFCQLSMTEGPFSGYPTINLDKKHLKDLHIAIEHVLFPERFPDNAVPDHI